MTWLSDIFTGPNNATVAIGRVLGALLFLGAVAWFPALVTAVLFFQHVEPSVWFAFMDKLMVYVPAMAVAAWALISGTNATEPKP